MIDERAAQIIRELPEGRVVLKSYFCVNMKRVEDKFAPVRTEIRKGQNSIDISKATRQEALTGIEKAYYQRAYTVAAVIYAFIHLEIQI